MQGSLGIVFVRGRRFVGGGAFKGAIEGDTVIIYSTAKENRELFGVDHVLVQERR